MAENTVTLIQNNLLCWDILILPTNRLDFSKYYKESLWQHYNDFIFVECKQQTSKTIISKINNYSLWWDVNNKGEKSYSDCIRECFIASKKMWIYFRLAPDLRGLHILSMALIILFKPLLKLSIHQDTFSELYMVSVKYSKSTYE